MRQRDGSLRKQNRPILNVKFEMSGTEENAKAGGASCGNDLRRWDSVDQHGRASAHDLPCPPFFGLHQAHAAVESVSLRISILSAVPGLGKTAFLTRVIA